MAKANQSYHKRDLYSDVTARILTELETGAAPWIKPWSATPGLNHPHNAATSRPYSGCNVVLLSISVGLEFWKARNFTANALYFLNNLPARERGIASPIKG